MEKDGTGTGGEERKGAGVDNDADDTDAEVAMVDSRSRMV